MTNCLNCNQPLPAHYCAHCGQKASTHRYSLKHFVVHDLVHGILHVDKGILFTIKELFTRPGHSVRAFIEGKRAPYFSYITLMIILIGLGHFLGEFSHLKLTDIVPEKSKAVMSEIERFSTKYPKLVPLFTIPISSLFSFLWFRKAKLNGTEHVIMNTYKASAELIIGILFSVVTIFYHNKQVLYLLYNVTALLTTVYTVWFYYQYFSTFGYKKYSLMIRSIMIPVSIALFYLVTGIVTAIISHQVNKQNAAHPAPASVKKVKALPQQQSKSADKAAVNFAVQTKH